MTTAEFPKSLAIFCNSLNENDDPFSNDYYWQAYQDLMLGLKRRGVQVYLVTDNNSYLGESKFAVGYTINAKTTLDNLIKVENIEVNMVFNRGAFVGQGVLTINDPYVMQICNNKIEMYKHFSAFQPFTIVCKNKEEILNAFERIQGAMIVVKEPQGEGGRGVYIGEKHGVLSLLPEKYPLLVQEFCDTSDGLKGYVQGVHDVRLSMCGGELIGCYVRKAKEGSLHSNVSQGGQMIFMDIREAPREALAMALEIDQLFAQYPRYYSVDFMNTDKGWKMLETNPILALLPATDGIEAKKTLNRLADYLEKIIKNT